MHPSPSLLLQTIRQHRWIAMISCQASVKSPVALIDEHEKVIISVSVKENESKDLIDVVSDDFMMEWSRPAQQGEKPTPRYGHTGVTIGENWFIVVGGDNKSGASESVVLNMSTLTWSVIASVQGCVPLASE
ncbi:unnamed protein product [Eruca vesicaria subsp. sativa]|uniref:Uncharacterized protein n=1 Tax=Eruca vesicaria subsp. sativa TaxID=29727 RepID=A0ABC8K5W6_ERUVS|nr:unnamed protein product [Eruca vesicaria subsp. sativa]